MTENLSKTIFIPKDEYSKSPLNLLIFAPKLA